MGMLSVVRLSGGVSTAKPWMGPGCSGPGVEAGSKGEREGTWMQVTEGSGALDHRWDGDSGVESA